MLCRPPSSPAEGREQGGLGETVVGMVVTEYQRSQVWGGMFCVEGRRGADKAWKAHCDFKLASCTKKKILTLKARLSVLSCSFTILWALWA